MKQIKLITLCLMVVLTTVVKGMTRDSYSRSGDVRARARRALQATVGNHVIPSLKDDADVKKYCTDVDIGVDDWKNYNQDDFEDASAKTSSSHGQFRDEWLEIIKVGTTKAGAAKIIKAISFPAIFPAFVLCLIFLGMFIWFLVWLCVRNCGDKKPVFYDCTLRWFKSPEVAKRVLVWTMIICFICFLILYVFWLIWIGLVIKEAKHVTCTISASHAALVGGLDTTSEFDFPGLLGVYDMLDQLRSGIAGIDSSLKTEVAKIDSAVMTTKRNELSSSYTTLENAELASPDKYKVMSAQGSSGASWTPDILSNSYALFKTPLKTEVKLLSDLMSSLVSIRSFLPNANTATFTTDLNNLEAQIAKTEKDFLDLKKTAKRIPTRAELNRVVYGITITILILMIIWVIYGSVFFTNAFLYQKWLNCRWINYILFGLLLFGGILINLFATFEVIGANVLNVTCYTVNQAYNDDNFIDKFAKPTDRSYKLVKSCIAPSANGTLDGLYTTSTKTDQFDDLIQSSKKYQDAKLDFDLFGEQLSANLTKRYNMEESDSTLAGDNGIDKAITSVNSLIASDNDKIVYSNTAAITDCTNNGFTVSKTIDPSSEKVGIDKYCISLKTKSNTNYLSRYSGTQPVSANTPLNSLMISVDDYQTKINNFRTEFAKFTDKENAAKAEILKSKVALDKLNVAFTKMNSIIADYGGNFFKSLDCGIMSQEIRRLEYGMCVKMGPPYMVHTAISVWLGILLLLVSCFYCTAIRWVAYETPSETNGAVYKIEKSESSSGKKGIVYVDKEADVKGTDKKGEKIYTSEIKGKDEEVKGIKQEEAEADYEELVLQPMD